MERLYLIRVDMERFLGPFTLKEVKEAYLRMEFGMQDEIAGSLRPWITFDDLEAIKRHYPELVQLVQREMLSGWGVSVHGQVSHQTKVKAIPQTSPNLIARTLLLTILTALIVAIILLLREGQLQDLLLYFKDRNYFNARSLYAETYNARFESYMDRNREAINQAMRKKKGFQQWLPLVRSVAFERDGHWEGLPNKRLRGKGDEEMPADCSMGAWEQRWLASRDSWDRFVEGRELPRADWVQILTMDPHWMKLRSPVPGWIRPQSYHEACLRMALKSLQRLPQDSHGEAHKMLMARMGWQLGLLEGADQNEHFEMAGTLWALSCIEDGHDAEALPNCLGSANLRSDWRQWLEATIALRRLAILTENKRELSPEQLALFERGLAEAEDKTKVLWLSYSEELQFYREILQQNGQVYSALQTLQQRFPQLHWIP